MHLMELLRDGLFSQWHISVARKKLREGQKVEKREDRWRDRGAQSGGMGVLKLGPLHSGTTESFERDNGLEGVIKRRREGENEEKRAGK